MMRSCQLFCIVLCLGAPSVFAANAHKSAEYFVKSIYAPFAAEHLKQTAREKVYSQSLLALMQRDNDLAGGEIGYLDYNPLCGCQDFKAFVPDIRIESSPEFVRAQVVFINLGKPKALTLVLRQEYGEWRVDDIFDTGNSLKDYLLKANDVSAKSR